MRASDTAARVGGEEFALILPGSDAETAFAVAERARENVAEIAVHGFELTCSAGIAAYPADAEDPAALSQLADSALYWAKRAGKRRTRRFDPEHSPATWTDRQRAEIVALLERERPIACVFQPVVSLATGRVVGYEALARFPGRACARRTSGSPRRTAAASGPSSRQRRFAPRWSRSDARSTPTSRSTSAPRRSRPSPSTDPARQPRGARGRDHRARVRPRRRLAAGGVADLRERGALIAIDDAGAGHAGLKQLMRVRPDIVKLDRR